MSKPAAATLILAIASAGLFACGSCSQNNADTPTTTTQTVSNDPQVIAFGARLFRTQGCVSCHTVDGRSSLAPTFLNAWGQPRVLDNGSRVTINAEYIKDSIRNPARQIAAGYTNQMIQYTEDKLSEAELDALVAFIASLSADNNQPPTTQPDDPTTSPTTTESPSVPAPTDQPPTPDNTNKTDPQPTPSPDAPTDEPPAESTEPPSQDQPDPTEQSPTQQLQLRDDGRPAWYLDKPTTSNAGVVNLSAEALGTSLRNATDAAITAARSKLRQQLNIQPNRPIPNESILNTLVLPLPNPGGQYRFVAYVTIAAPQTSLRPDVPPQTSP